MSSEPTRRNPYLKAVDYVIHRKLRDSRKTTGLMENYVIHRAPVETKSVGIFIFCVKNYVIHKKLRDSHKTTNCKTH